MALRRRPVTGPPPRQPHPDGSIEVQLQRILSLRLAIGRKEDLLASDQQQLSSLREKVTDHPNWDGHTKRLAQIQVLRDEMAGLEDDIVRLHDEIAAHAGKLSQVDLSYLDPLGSRP
jgi:hypothetical protein